MKSENSHFACSNTNLQDARTALEMKTEKKAYIRVICSISSINDMLGYNHPNKLIVFGELNSILYLQPLTDYPHLDIFWNFNFFVYEFF